MAYHQGFVALGGGVKWIRTQGERSRVALPVVGRLQRHSSFQKSARMLHRTAALAIRFMAILSTEALKLRWVKPGVAVAAPGRWLAICLMALMLASTGNAQ